MKYTGSRQLAEYVSPAPLIHPTLEVPSEAEGRRSRPKWRDSPGHNHPTNHMATSIGVFGILFDHEKRVLLCHRRDIDLWNLPGGHLEDHEAPWEGVVREIQEETGLITRVERLAGIYHKPQQSEIAFSFICSVVGGTITTNTEADRIEYFTPEQLPKKLSPKQVERIHDALASPTTVLKTQIGKSSRELIQEGKL